MNDLSLWLRLVLQPRTQQTHFLHYSLERGIENLNGQHIQNWLKEHGLAVDESLLNQCIRWCEQPNQGVIGISEYPQLLIEIPDPPLALFYRGDPRYLAFPMISVVGSRKPSPAGMENCDFFCHTLSQAGLCLVSGMAQGIDARAHQMALTQGNPTIAVMGCGLNHCYPAKHRKLWNQIAQQGLLISEFLPDTPVNAWQFPKRNRLISGLSEGLLVVEAALKSGSLVTARLAAEQGRQVFSIPGDIHNPVVHGCHHLIREGAELVFSPDQILDALVWLKRDFELQQAISRLQDPLSEDEQKLMQCIDRRPRMVDQLIDASGLHLTLVLELLFSLELKGLINSTADGYFQSKSGKD